MREICPLMNLLKAGSHMVYSTGLFITQRLMELSAKCVIGLSTVKDTWCNNLYPEQVLQLPTSKLLANHTSTQTEIDHA